MAGLDDLRSSVSESRSVDPWHDPRVDDILTGALAVVVGLALCFRGYLAIRILLPIWGAFVGFGVGVGVVAAVTGDGVLATLGSWLVGLAAALLFALGAYLYYEVCIVIAMGAAGFVIGSTVLMAFGIDWSWLITLGGLAVGVAFAVLAIVADLPMVLLTVLTALAGAATATTGVMLLVGSVDVDDLGGRGVVHSFEGAGLWWMLYVALAIVGVISQVRTLESLSRSVREEWELAGGRGLNDPHAS